jgi:bifunctional DNA-binding transcriptional regulator/antitoxin component of YhaV-PrlF toxin-antitoxin module
MGYFSKLQVIQRANQNRQYYLICPAPLAQALEMKKGETLEWVVEDRDTIVIKRAGQRAPEPDQEAHE